MSGAVSGGVLAGTYTAPNSISGGFSSLNVASGTVTTYCGTGTSPDGPLTFNMQIASNGTVSGTAISNVPPACAFTGLATGNTLSLVSCEQRTGSGTIQGTSVSGIFNGRNGQPNGTFTGSTSACQ